MSPGRYVSTKVQQVTGLIEQGKGYPDTKPKAMGAQARIGGGKAAVTGGLGSARQEVPLSPFWGRACAFGL